MAQPGYNAHRCRRVNPSCLTPKDYRPWSQAASGHSIHSDHWRFFMRKTLAITAATGALLFGGAGVANASSPAVPASASTTTVAQTGDNTNTNHSDKTGLWGLLGLAGLAGLAGLRRRNDAPAVTGTTAPRAHG